MIVQLFALSSMSEAVQRAVRQEASQKETEQKTCPKDSRATLGRLLRNLRVQTRCRSHYRVSPIGLLQRRIGGAWTRVCKHDQPFSLCQQCASRAHSICLHGRRKSRCKDCGGASMCAHGKRRSQCVECDGSSLCRLHQRHKWTCRECNGASICQHGRRKSRCNECRGASMCEHWRRRAQCTQCQGSRVCRSCNRRLIIKDGCCTTCHPDWRPTVSGIGKTACECWDRLECELNIVIQHGHYDRANNLLPHPKDEFRPPEYPSKPVDGYYADERTVFEFLGNHPHGHPHLPTAPYNWRGQLLATQFAHTERVLGKLTQFGYRVFYIWESDYTEYRKNNKQGKEEKSLWSYFREFDGQLQC